MAPASYASSTTTTPSVAHHDQLAEHDAFVQRFLHSNYFAAENLGQGADSKSLTWDRMGAGFAAVGMHAFTNNAVSSATRRSTMASCDSVISSLDDAALAIATDSSALCRALESHLVGEDMFVNADILDTFQPRTKEAPDEYVAGKHLTYRSAVQLGHGLGGEDYVVLETMGRDVDPDGHPFVFKMLRSVDAIDVDAHEDHTLSASRPYHSSRVRRGVMHACMIILSETQYDGVLRMQLWLDVDLPRSATTETGESLDSSFSSLFDALSLALRYRRHIERVFALAVKRAEPEAVAYATTHLFPTIRARHAQCQVCERKLGFLKLKRHSCSICKVSLCGTCCKGTDVCAWQLCACCYTRNYALFSREIVSKIASGGLGRLASLARKAPGYSAYRQTMARDHRAAHAPVPSSGHNPRRYHANDTLFGLRSEARNESISGSSVQSRTSSCGSSRSSVSSVDTRHAMPNHGNNHSQRQTLTELDLTTEGSDKYKKPRRGRAPDPPARGKGVTLLDDQEMSRLSFSSMDSMSSMFSAASLEEFVVEEPPRTATRTRFRFGIS